MLIATYFYLGLWNYTYLPHHHVALDIAACPGAKVLRDLLAVPVKDLAHSALDVGLEFKHFVPKALEA